MAVVSGVVYYKRVSKERLEMENNPLYNATHLQTFHERDTLTYENSQYVSSSSEPKTESSNPPIYDEIPEIEASSFYEMDDVIGESDSQAN